MSGNKYLTLSSGVDELLASNNSSAGSGDANKIVALNSSGLIDSSMLPAIAAAYTPRTDTASFSALINHFESVDIVTAAATVTATLPDATAFPGETLLVQAATADGTHHVAFATVSAQTINAASAASLPVLSIVDQTYFFVSDGVNWWTIQPVIDLVSNVTNTLPVLHGGTGQTSLTVHGVVVGNTTSGVNVTSAGAAGTVLTGNGAADPTFQVPTALANTMSVTVTETIAAGAMINLWASTGLKVRNADNTDATKQADGFALTGASSGLITVVIGSAPNTQQTSLTVGTRYFLGTAGAVTATAPSSTGDLVQSLGIAVTTTELQVIIGNVTTIA